jgi:hypothetical protein
VFPSKSDRPLLTLAEAIAAGVMLFLTSAIVIAYLTDRIGMEVFPTATLVASIAVMLAVLIASLGQADRGGAELAACTGIVLTVMAYVLWLAWPALLPPGGGSDLTHHLQLVDYIDRHWRLVHDAAVEPYLGEMVHYTPGAHLLASLVGRWIGSDGFHAIYMVVAFAVALKAGFIFLIARRAIGSRGAGSRSALAFALLAAGLVFVPRALVLGSFTRFSYIAQIVSETFVVAMWWALMAWDERPSRLFLLLFTAAGIGTFLTWPVWIGPIALVFGVVVIIRSDLTWAGKVHTLAVTGLPILLVAAVHAIGRLGWTRIVRTDARTALPTAADFGWPFLLLGAAGLVMMVVIMIVTKVRRNRVTVLLAIACGMQAAALYVAAKSNGAVIPYMAIKMAYLIVYPLAVAGALTVAQATDALARLTGPRRWLEWVSVAVVALGVAMIARDALRHPLTKATVSVPLYEAGRWARLHAEPACVEYIVGQPDTAYWLHLAVLGNRRMSRRTADDSTFEGRDAIVRWINPGGLRYAIADLAILPRDILESSDELARFDTAVVLKNRRPAPSCPP